MRDANMLALRRLLPELRIAVLARLSADHALRTTYSRLPALETRVVAAALGGGWADFKRLNQEEMLGWLAASGLLPSDWPVFSPLVVTDKERAHRAKLDEAARIAATTVRRTMDWSGGTFTFGVDSLGSLADDIAGRTAANSALLGTSARTLKGKAPEVRASRGGGGAGGGGGSDPASDEERSLIGFFGEAIAFEWLKHKFGHNRAVDENCWKSAYREQVYGGEGDDSLGYDFEVRNGDTRWYFEVKSTRKPAPLQVQSIELGSSEFNRAEACKADRTERFRILYITDAMKPESARIFMLPNPRSREGRAFYTDLQAGHRLYFPLKP